MATLTFDTLKLARRLEGAGFTREQATGAAEALAETLGDALDTLATRSDLDNGLAAVRHDLRETELRLEAKIEANRAAIETTRAALETRIESVRAEILKWMFGAMAAQTGLIVALLKLLP